MIRNFLFLLFILPISLQAQNYDRIWLFGYDSDEADTLWGGWGGTVVDFNIDPPDIFYEFREPNISITNASITDSLGELLFYTNGISIFNAEHEIMDNGGDLNPGFLAEINQNDGYRLTQGALILSLPESDNLYYVIHMDVEPVQGEYEIHSKKLYYSLVDINQNDNLGIVLEKNQIIINNILETGDLTATKHANGRDWWILIRKYDSNQYYRILITLEGIVNKGIQSIGAVTPISGLGQAVFSPDGSKFVNVSLVDGIGGNAYVNIYNFDRCIGELSEPIQITYSDSAWTAGVAISLNSRFLYVSSYNYLYQYDLWADDIPITKDTVAIYDGFLEEPIWRTYFWLCQLASNGKIYISSSAASHYLHVVNRPDLPRDSCDVCQHCIELPTWNSQSMPNFPNYRLGHLEGSSCDTLRQLPTAIFDYEIIGNEVHFIDSSYHDIRSWQWDFGNGEVDSVAHPVHGYVESGVYEVCLTVSNPRGEDTLCQVIEVIVTSTLEEAVEGNVSVVVFPNPVETSLNIELREEKVLVPFYLFNALGQEVMHQILEDNLTTVDVSGLSSGVYWWWVESSDGTLGIGKLVKK